MKTHHKISLGGISLFAVITLILGLRFGVNNASTANPLVAGSETSDALPSDPDAEQPAESPIVPEEEMLPPDELSEETPPITEEDAPVTTTPEEESAPQEPEEEVVPEEPAVVDETPEEVVEVPSELTSAETVGVPAPFAEVRSMLEPGISTIDWLYTLRAGADYDAITNAKESLKVNLTDLTDTLEGQTQMSFVVNALFCGAGGNLSALQTKLTPFADDTQQKVDEQNAEILRNLSTQLTRVRQVWVDSQGTTLTCSS